MTRLSPRILLALFAFLAVATPAPAQAQTTSSLPDLAAMPPWRPVIEDLTHEGVFLRAMRFNGYILNQGSAAAEVNATDRNGDTMQSVTQRLFDDPMDRTIVSADGSTPVVRYESADGHRHWHLHNAARYSLWNAAGTAEVAPSSKVGFCLTDSYNATTNESWPGGVYHDTCGANLALADRPTASTIQMGLSAGWQDIYGRDLWYQWVDISHVPPGHYRLAGEVDPDALIAESDETNAIADRPITVPGWISNPVSTDIAGTGATTVTLDADPVQETRDDDHQVDRWPIMSIATPEFRIEDPPARGTLSQPADTWFSGGTVRYTPGPGGPADDTFTYSVREAGSPFPLSPPRTAVTLTARPTDPPPDEEQPPVTTVGEGPAAPPDGALEQPPMRRERVAISGAPAEMVAGTSVQLTATVLDSTSPTVRWSATAGRVTPDGVFTASRTRPSATVRATAAGGAFAEAVIQFVAAKRQQPLPTACGGSGRSARAAIGRLCVRYVRRALMVSVTPRSAGRLRVALRRGGKVLKRCRFRAAKGRRYGCSLKVRRSRRLAATVSLKRRGGRVLTKRLAVR